MSAYFESIGSNKNEVEYLNKYYAVLIENSLKNLDSVNRDFLKGEEEDKATTSNVVIMIMITLYNFRHLYKIIEETNKGASPSSNKGLTKRFEAFNQTVNRL